MQATQKPISGLNQEDIRNWFDKLISHISVDKIMMETNTAPTEIKEFYTNAMLDDYHKMSKAVRDQSTKYFIVKLLEDYLSELKSFKIFPQKLAFDFSDAKILVWAQISNEDEKAEDALILSEAKANSKYSEAGFYVSSTIVEESDNLKIPPHYHEVKIHGGLSSSH
jgi:hypothetical protein